MLLTGLNKKSVNSGNSREELTRNLNSSDKNTQDFHQASVFLCVFL